MQGCTPKAAGAQEDTRVASLQKLLQSKLTAAEAEDFEAGDLELLVEKGFYMEWQLQQATKDKLQKLPGKAVKILLIDALLRAFNPAALQQGMMPPAAYMASVSSAAFLLQSAFLGFCFSPQAPAILGGPEIWPLFGICF